MLEGFSGLLKGLDRRVKVSVAAAGVYNFCLQLSAQYDMLFAQALGASGTDIGLINSLGAAVNATASAPIGSAVEKYTVKKIMLLGYIFDSISLIIFVLAGNWWVLIPAFAMRAQLIRNAPLTDIVLITFTEPEKRSTIMSLSRVFWSIINVFAPVTAAIVVASFGGINAQGMRPLYYIQLVLYISLFFVIAKGLGTTSVCSNGKKDESSQKKTSLLKDYREFLKGEKYLKRWIIIRIFRDGGQALSMSFISLWMVNDKGATPAILGIVSAISIIAAMSLQIPAGRLADKFGRKRTFYLFTPFYYLGTLALISVPSPEYLILAGLLGGVGMGMGIGGVAFTPFITMWWEMAPAEKRGRWYGLEGLIMATTRIPASIIGGILWDQGHKIEVLLIPILIDVLVVIPLLHTIPDTLRSK